MENDFIGLPPHSEGVRGTLESFPVEISCAWRRCGYRSTRREGGTFLLDRQGKGWRGGGGKLFYYRREGKVRGVSYCFAL
jgi:hypothetical protein